MRYKAVKSVNIEELNFFCNNAIDAGYVPLGGISVTSHGNSVVYSQALIYNEEPHNENSNNRQSSES